MNTKGLAKFYDQLEPHERFRLVLRARARGDETEADRLGRMCPRKTYRMSDAAYADRLDLSGDYVLALLTELLPKLAKLRMVDTARVLFDEGQFLPQRAAEVLYDRAFEDGARAAWRAAGRAGEPPATERDNEAVASLGDEFADALAESYGRILDQVAAELANDARVLWEAFGCFSRDELGLEAETVIGAWARPALDVLEEHRAALDAATASPTSVEETTAAFRAAWRRRILGEME